MRVNGTTDGGYLDDAGYDQQKATLRYDFEGEQWRASSVLDFANLNQETAGYLSGYKAYQDASIRRDNPNPRPTAMPVRCGSIPGPAAPLDDRNTLTITPHLRDQPNEFLQLRTLATGGKNDQSSLACAQPSTPTWPRAAGPTALNSSTPRVTWKNTSGKISRPTSRRGSTMITR